MAVNEIQYTGANSDSGLSKMIWRDCPIDQIAWNPSIGYGYFDDFLHVPIQGTITTLIMKGDYNWFGSSGATITPGDTVGGEIVLTEATDNQSVSMTYEQHPFIINSATGQLWFEARMKTSTITADEQGWMVGLMDTTALSAAVPVTATGTIADVNFVGFHHPEGNTAAFDCSYKADGVTAVEVNSDVGTLVAGTYVKLGMRFHPQDPRASGAATLRFYIDGVQQATTKTIPASSGTDFPADIGLAPVVGQTLANSAAETLTLDWWACYQLRTA
jgi:hypothetical protein